MRLLFVTAAIAALAGPAAPADLAAGKARIFSTADLLAMENFGKVRITPDGRWTIVERQARWDSAATYRFNSLTSHLLSRLEVFADSADTPAITLGDPGGAVGYVSGPIAPGGRRMVVYRLTADSWRLGVLTFDTGAVDWFDVTPEYPRLGQTVAWRSDQDLVLIARALDDLPLFLRAPGMAQDRITALWRDAAAGHRPSAVYIPSGSRREARARGPLPRLIRLDLATGAQTELARGEFFDLELAPDGRTVAALKDAEDLQPDISIPAVVGEWMRRRRLVIADVETGRAREPLPDQDFATHLLSWSPDSDRLLAFGRDAEGRFETGQFWTVRPDGRSTTLHLGHAAPWLGATWDGIPLVRGAWSHEGPVVQVRTRDGERAWLSFTAQGAQTPVRVRHGADRLTLVDDQLMVVSRDGVYAFADGGAPLMDAALSAASTTFDGGDRRNHNPDALWLGAQALVSSGGCLADTRRLTTTCPPSFQPKEVVLAAAAPRAALVTRRRSSEGALRLFRRTPSEAVLLGALNTALETRAWGRIERIDHAGPQGESLSSWLLLPPNHRGPPPPVVIVPYPGDVHAEAPGWFQPGHSQRHINPQVLAGAGYAVLAPSLPYAWGGRSDLSDLSAQLDVIVDAAAGRGLVDPDRAALVGHSFGAHAALVAATQTDRYRAIVASNGFADLSSIMDPRPQWRSSTRDGVGIIPMAGWAETGQGGVGRSFVEDPQAYVDRSPLYDAASIVTPTLLIESDLDGARLGMMFSALYRQNREAALLTHFGEGHTYASPANIRDLHERILAWLDERLAPPAPGDAGLPGPNPSLQHSQDQGAIGSR